MGEEVGGERRGERGEPGSAVKRAKVQKGWVAKLSGLYREEPLVERQSGLWAAEVRVEGGVWHSYLISGRD